MDALNEAVGRFNESQSEPPEATGESETETSETTGGKGHSFHIKKHKNGKHHLTVEGENGQLVHHSEHDSLDEAADEAKKHGEETHVD
jgi:hypothetical protein